MKRKSMKIRRLKNNLHSVSKKKAIKEEASKKGDKIGVHDYKPKHRYEKDIKQRDLSSKRDDSKSAKEEQQRKLPNQEAIEQKRKQSDLIIKKGKVVNIGSNFNSKSVSPIKRGSSQQVDESQSS